MSLPAFVRRGSARGILRPTACLAGILLSGAPAFSQPQPFSESWRWVHFTAESGLPANQRLWFNVTDDGTCWANSRWFDGFRWKSVDEAAEEARGFTYLSAGFVPDGLIGARGDRELNLVRKTGSTKLTTLDFSAVYYAVLNPESLLICSEAGRLHLFAHGVVQPFSRTSGLENTPVVGLWRTANGVMFANTTVGLFRFDGSSWRLWLPSPSRTLVLPSEPMLVENDAGTGAIAVLLPIEARGIWRWSAGAPPSRTALPASHLRIVSLGLTPDDEMLASLENGEVHLRNRGSWIRLPYLESMAEVIHRLEFTRNGDFWMVGKGELFRYRRSIRHWDFVKSPDNPNQDFIHEILRSRDGSLWLATRNGVVTISADGKRRSITRIEGRNLHSVTGLAEDDKGNLWISSGADFGGAYRWDGRGWTDVPIPGDGYRSLIHKIRKDRTGGLWFLGIGDAYSLAGARQPGAFRYHAGAIERWDVARGLLHGRVYDFAEGPDGSYWFAVKGGISRWRPATPGRPADWRHWTSRDGLDPNETAVYCVAIGPDSTIWFGHRTNGGLGRIGIDGTVRYYTHEDGLVDDGVRDLEFDDDGALWIATGGGISSFMDEVFTTYDEKTGLIPPDSWPIQPDGEMILVGTLGGGVAALRRAGFHSPSPSITLHPARTVGTQTILEWQPLAYWSEVPPSEILTRFRLGGGVWSSWSTSRRTSYLDLDHGGYEFTVQARGPFGEYDPAGTQISFEVLPPLYLRPVVFFPGVLAAAGIVALAVILLWRKRAYDLSIRASEEQYRLITQLMSDYAYLVSLEPGGSVSIAWVTDSFTRLTGYTVEEAKAGGFLERFVHPEELSDALADIRTLLDGNPREVERRVVAKGGEVLWTSNYAIPIMDKDSGRVTHIYGVARDITRRKHDESQLRRLAGELSRTEEQERRRMANFLHDGISQSLLISKRKLDALRERKDLSAVFERTLAEVAELLQGTIDNSRTLTFDLCPPILYDLGLAPAVDWLVEQMREAHKLDVSFTDDGKPKPLAGELRNTLYAGAREALMNIVKHAGARNVWIDLSRIDGEVVLAVEDDGAGFDPRAGASARGPGSGFGLQNLRERLTHLGGRFDIESAAGKGTRLTLAAPAAPDPETGAQPKGNER